MMSYKQKSEKGGRLCREKSELGLPVLTEKTKKKKNWRKKPREKKNLTQPEQKNKKKLERQTAETPTHQSRCGWVACIYRWVPHNPKTKAKRKLMLLDQ